jgi:predicted Na+-dependent transporter
MGRHAATQTGVRLSDLIAALSNLAVQLFAVGSMASIGLRYSVEEIVGPLRNFWAVVLALVANFVAVPLLALGILQLIELDVAHAIGLVLVASAAGAPMIIKFTQIATGDVAFSAGLLVLLIVVSIGYMPLVVPLLAPGTEISPWTIAAPLVLTMLLPLAAGLMLKRLAPGDRAHAPNTRHLHERFTVDVDRAHLCAQSNDDAGRVRNRCHYSSAALHRRCIRYRVGARRCLRRAPARRDGARYGSA